MKTKLFIRDGKDIFVLKNDEIFELKKINPIHFLEFAILGCIGKGIVNYLKYEQVKNPFENIEAKISNSTIKIFCKCEEKFKDDFRALVKGCFVVEKLAFKKETVFL